MYSRTTGKDAYVTSEHNVFSPSQFAGNVILSHRINSFEPPEWWAFGVPDQSFSFILNFVYVKK